MSSAARVREFRRRQREAEILLPRFSITAAEVDDLAEAGLLPGWDVDDPQAVVAAIKRLLTLLPERIAGDE